MVPISDVISILAVLVFLCNLYAFVDIVLGVKRLRQLADVGLRRSTSPMVSIIVPACNEEKTLEPALRSLFNLEYTPIEIIVVNDRSTDKTGDVLLSLQKDYPELKILTITDLPDGWLGKNNALYQGAKKARGDYLLFTDADILFAKTTLSRAVSLVLSEKLDHLSLIFKNIAKGFLLNAMMVDAGGGLLFLFRPWKVSDPQSKRFMGVGAFNLVKKTVYVAIGGHASIRMHPIDDIILGKVIKQNAFKQECLTAYDFLQVHWYDSTAKMIQGLMKNIFALYNFNIAYAMIGVLTIFVLTILPLWLVFLSTGVTRGICVLCVCLRLISAVYGAKVTGTTLQTVPFSLLTPYINIYIILTGMVKTIANDGIEWRGTHYSLSALKKSMSIFT